MRVGHVIESSRLSDGGPSSALLALCEALADSDCHSEIACRHSDWAGVTVGRTRMVVLPQRLWGNRASIRAFAQGVDVLHLHGLWDSLPAAAGKYAAQAGIPYVVSLHGMLLRRSLAHHRLRKRLFLAAVGRKILAGAAALHFTTQAELDHAAAMLPVGPRRVVIPLTVESRLLAGLPESVQWREFFPGIPDSWPRLLFLSRIHPVKNLPALIAALPPLIKEFPVLPRYMGNPKLFRKLAVIAVVGGFVLFTVQLVYRSAGFQHVQLGYALSRTNPVAAVDGFELDWTGEAMRNYGKRFPYLDGQSYYAVLVNPVPRVFWRDKPGGYSDVNAANLDFGFGTTMTSAWLGEAYANFGWFGIPIVGLVAGVLMGILDVFIRRSGAFAVAVFLPLQFHWAFWVRGDSVSYMDTWLFGIILLSVAMVLTGPARHADQLPASMDAANIAL